MNNKVLPGNFRYEFFKIERVDLSVAAWIKDKHPNALYSFIEFIAREYQIKGINIDINRLYGELQ